jgi:hypothetical protein
MPAMSLRVLFVTDLTYQARGRRYCDEDIYLSSALREHFTVSLCHPLDAEALMDGYDAVVVRNTGPAIHYRDAYDRFRHRAQGADSKVFTQLTGKADQVGKDYLLELFAAGYPVIPTIDDGENLDRLPQVPRYVVKPKLGADSVGLHFVDRDELDRTDLTGMLVQPAVSFAYEVSFYFVDRTFHYALYAPEPDVRWGLTHYQPTDADLAFAQKFVDWNDVDHGIQRVDACRTTEGELLLVEVEDWNPYLSLDLVADAQRDVFVAHMVASIRELASS